MKRRPTFLFGLIFIFGLGIGLAVTSTILTEEDVEPAIVEETSEKTREELFEEAAIIAEDIELTQGKQGVMTWKLQAVAAQYNLEKGLVGVDRPQLTAYFGDDRQEVYVKADRGEVDQADDNLTLHDNVTGRFGDLALDAQHLDYVGAINKVYLKGGVTVRHPDMTLTAAAVEIDLVTRQLVAAGGVSTLLAPHRPALSSQ